MTEWIKCIERLPDSTFGYSPIKQYLTYDGINFSLVSYSKDLLLPWSYYGFTHWMPLPEAPHV